MNRDKIGSIVDGIIGKVAKVMSDKEYEDFMEHMNNGTLPNTEYLGNGLSHRTVREYLDAVADKNYDHEEDPEGYISHGISEYQGMQSELRDMLVNEHPHNKDLNDIKSGLLEYLKQKYNMTDIDKIVDKFIDDLV